MLTQLGRTAAPGDAVDLFLECHERIRAFLDLARRMAEPPVADDAAVADAATRVHRYFAQALPLHAEDEERSLLPRLRGLDPAVDAALAAMAREHAEHERPIAALLAASQALAAEPRRHPELAPSIGAATRELELHFGRHLRREEEVIFPAARRLLDGAERTAIVREMRARRAAAAPRLG